MMKKINVYLESSALWNLYYEEDGATLVEFCLEAEELSCLSSIWSLLELHRGIQKRLNQQELDREEATHLRVFVDTDLQLLIAKKKLSLWPVSEDVINNAKPYIPRYNLFASDALHLATAVVGSSRGLLVDDHHFSRLDTRIEEQEELKIWPTSMEVEHFLSTLRVES